MKRFLALFLALVLAFALCACGQTAAPADSAADKGTDSSAAEENVFRSAETWMYDTLDPHVDYQGWNIIAYGLIETLFTLNEDSELEPQLAVSADTEDDGLTWTIELRDDVTFSDGDPMTAEIVADNLKDLAEKNGRYTYLADADISAEDDTHVVVKLEEPYMTLPQDLADPDTAIIKVDKKQDIENAPVCTGPFQVESFDPGAEVVVVRNDNYWNGKAKIDKAVFTYVPDFDTQMMAMQNGELSVLNSPTTAALDVFSKDSDYEVVSVPTSRNLFYYLNCDRLSDNVRKAINLAVDSKALETLMNDTVTSISGPFISSMPYGKATKPATDPDAAKAALEADGYKLNSDGFYEKDGKVLDLDLCYYPSRSIDKMSALLQEQLEDVGIKTELKSFDDPDAGYVTIHDFDIGMYSCLAAPGGDPYYFLNTYVGDNDYNAGNYKNEEVTKMLKELSAEADNDKRAELANKIVQQAIDDNAYGFLIVYNQTVILKKGVSNVGENNPNFEGLNVNSVVG